jgi:hypothetical protein
LILGKSTQENGQNVQDNGYENDPGEGKLVYFNSNDFHGNQFITPAAIDAGYSNDKAVDREGLVEKGIGSLIKLNADGMSQAAEDSLLRALVLFAKSRNTIKNSMEVSDASSSRSKLNWSSPEKAWLFSHLVERNGEIPSNRLGLEQQLALRAYLSSRPDAPPGAFGIPMEELSRQTPRDDAYLDVSVISDSQERSKSESNAVSDGQHSNGQALPHKSGFDIWDDEENVEEWAASVDVSFLEQDDEPSIVNSSALPANGMELHPELDEIQSSSSVDDIAELEYTTSKKQKDGDYIDTEAVVSDIPSRRDRAFATPGVLDRFFSSEMDFFTSTAETSMADEERAEMAVQELYSTLLWTSALARLALLKDKLVQASGRLLEQAKNVDNEESLLSTEDANAKVILSVDNTLSLQELTTSCASLTAEIRDASATVHNLHSAAQRISKRLMDASASTGISEGHSSKAQYDELTKQLEHHMTELDKWTVGESDEDEAYEDTLERAQEEWEDLYDDSYMWSPADARTSKPLVIDKSKSSLEDMDYLFDEDVDSEDDESLEEALARMDLDWGDTESSPDPSRDGVELNIF